MAILSSAASLVNKAVSSSSRAQLRTIATILFVDASCRSEEPAGPLHKKQVGSEDSEWLLWTQDSAVGQRGLKQRQGKANNLQAESNKSKPQDVSSIDGQLLKPPAPDPEPEPEMEDSPGSLQKSLSQRLSRRVNISDLENYVRMALQSGELQRQHAGYKADKFYIATQGPRPNTVVDFWRMVWQEQVSVIAMLANVIENGKKKCEQYWPELGKEETHGAVTILTADVSVFADFTFRHFNVSCKSKKRKVSHLHFTSWPDHGVPFYPQSVAAYLKKLLLTPRGTGPILVHCSAGVGRTGTIILADICLRMAAAEGAVDILGFQQSMREQRPNMVDNLEQYKLVHLVLLECLVEEPSSYPCDDTLPQLINMLSESGTLYKQFQRLQEVQWLDQALKPPSGAQVDKARIPQPTNKDRCSNIIPGYNGRVYLTRYPLEDTTSDYINAVSVDGFRTKDQFIVTQFPLKNTVGDFWRLVLEKNIPLIVVLNEIDMSDKSLSMCEFRPLSDQPLTPVPYLTVRLKQQSHNAIWSVTTYQLTDTSVTTGLPQQQIVRMLQLSGWQANCDLPPNVNTLLQLWQEVERLYSGKCPILVTCLDGSKSCGLFLAVAFLVEKIKLEQQCDVCHAVRTIRQNREQFITTEEQFQFLYAVAVNYLEAFQTYANFN
uniref:protein-tyrosine-phosphatase n=1 Tax=Timema shepardi TaxID=629360 RepID=A0A7R9ALI3_TIMSH|nr:unnamed protein product [Timema shepardi]